MQLVPKRYETGTTNWEEEALLNGNNCDSQSKTGASQGKK